MEEQNPNLNNDTVISIQKTPSSTNLQKFNIRETTEINILVQEQKQSIDQGQTEGQIVCINAQALY